MQCACPQVLRSRSHCISPFLLLPTHHRTPFPPIICAPHFRPPFPWPLSHARMHVRPAGRCHTQARACVYVCVCMCAAAYTVPLLPPLFPAAVTVSDLPAAPSAQQSVYVSSFPTKISSMRVMRLPFADLAHVGAMNRGEAAERGGKDARRRRRRNEGCRAGGPAPGGTGALDRDI
jgi:hypothetical protein